MNNESKNLWVEALRSGAFEQVRRTLFSKTTGGFCCLGVYLKAVKGYTPITEEEETLSGVTLSCFKELCELGSDTKAVWWMSIMEEEGVTRSVIEKLMNMNDYDHKNFNEIADWIENNL